MTSSVVLLDSDNRPKALEPSWIEPPPAEQHVARGADFPVVGEKPSRYTLPEKLRSTSPVGYRVRQSLTRDETDEALELLSIERPEAFVDASGPSEGELFDECSLGILSSRQSTNFRGHHQVTLGPDKSEEVARLLGNLGKRTAPVLDGATHTHIVWSRRYATPFTMLLTLAGHKPVSSLLTVPLRALQKKFLHTDDIPTIGYLQQLHVGILADAMERAAVIASAGKRKAQVHLAPFCGEAVKGNRQAIRKLEQLCGLGSKERAFGWRIALVAQVGQVSSEEVISFAPGLMRKIGANLLAFRSERIQPGVNQEKKAPAQYQERQDMDVPDSLTIQAGRAAYNAFSHWTGCDREQSKDLLILDRVDVLTPNGKERLRAIRDSLGKATDCLVRDFPLWADLPTGKLFSRNAARGRKAFALTGQRIYIAGLSKPELAKAELDWELGVCGVGAAASRSALYSELMGVTDIPEGCDLLAGTCIMAGPVNQNDIGKQFYGHPDLLADTFPDRDPTSLLLWTLKGKTIADPIGNEEQLLNAHRKGALVDLRAGPHEVVEIDTGSGRVPMRSTGGLTNQERAFGEQENFVTSPEGKEIAGNRGQEWPELLSRRPVW